MLREKCRKYKIGRTDLSPLFAAVDQKKKIYKLIDDFKTKPNSKMNVNNLE